MKRTFFGPSGVLSAAMVCLAAGVVGVAAPSCGGDVVVDGDSSSSNIGDGGASNASGTPVGPGPSSVGPSSVTNGVVASSNGVGPAGPAVASVGPGPGPSQVSSSSGMPGCDTCAEFVSGGDGPLCPGSEQIYSDLVNCACSFCSFQCQLSCTGVGMNDDSCDQCITFTIQDACAMQFQSCANDL